MENTYPNPGYNENILDDVDFSLYQASSGKRFANYLIDLVANYVLMALVGFVLAIVQPDSAAELVNDNSLGNQLAWRLFAIVIYVLYMWILEAATKGKSLGKLITGTRAVNLDGTRINARTALLRSLSRIVPFEPFSALGSPSHPWHDGWTDTYVVDEKLSRLPQQQA